MKRLLYICMAIVFCQINIHAQKETSWWHFGYKSGLNFNSISDVKASDNTVVSNMPQAIVGALSTAEGCFTVSTYDGNFLFSSDGLTVYDKNYDVMPNGTGLLGHPSSTQSGIVIPKPGSSTQYYVVTVPSLDDPSNGIQYSTVDMALRGGLGDVIPESKNRTILAGPVSENIAAVPNANDLDYWLIHRIAGTFYVFPVTAAGISSTPSQTISTTGISTVWGSSLGELIVSSDYTKIISCNWFGKQIISADFDPATGKVSNIKSELIPTIEATYAASFSPDNKHIYVTTGYYNPRLFHNTWSGLRSGVTSTLLGFGPSNLKQAVDGRLYGIRTTTNPIITSRDLYVIMNPNEGGTIIKTFPNYLKNVGVLGLPSFPAGFIRIKPKSKPFACATHERSYGVEIDLSGGNAPVKLEWSFGDGTPIETQILGLHKTEYIQKHAYRDSGIYMISVTPYKADGTKAKTITMEANIVICSLKSNLMSRSALLNSKQQQK